MNQLNSIDIPFICYYHSLDNRYGENAIYSHNSISFPSVSTDNLMSMINTDKYLSSKYIFIDEAQFFDESIIDFVKLSTDTHNKHVYISSLNGDSNRNHIGHIHHLYPLTDSIEFKVS